MLIEILKVFLLHVISEVYRLVAQIIQTKKNLNTNVITTVVFICH